VAIRLENTAICQYSVMNLSADFSKTVESSPRHFTSRGPLFEASYIFDAQLYKFKTNTRRIVWAKTIHQWSQFTHYLVTLYL
jgi:hypothetical protein